MQIIQRENSEQNRSNFLKNLFEITQFKESIDFKFYPSDVSFDLINKTFDDLAIFELFDFFSARARLINYLNNNKTNLSFKNKMILKIESLKIRCKGSHYLLNKIL